ncbi:MAG: hypothetical protein WCF78_01730 [archaeon]
MQMSIKKYFKGGILTAIGFLLSPLSWWNDLIINIPLAYLFSFLLSLVIKGIFLESMVFFYWLTNILGLCLMHYGLKNMKKKNLTYTRYTKKDLLMDIIFALLYTLLIVLLIKFKILNLPMEYLS